MKMTDFGEKNGSGAPVIEIGRAYSEGWGSRTC